MKAFFLSCLTLVPAPLLACDLALVLAVDVSGSVDRDEYNTQMQGLATGLRDGIVVDALIDQSAKVTLIQWSGSTRQRQTVPWVQIGSYADVLSLADRIANDPRVWRNFSTAVGEALDASLAALEGVSDCTRKVIDVSGDGVSNEGVAPQSIHPALKAQGVIVNGLAIETDQTDLTAYFFGNLIIGEGAFVVTANGFEDYPAQIKRKLQRETTKQLSSLD
ncbi:MAG: Ca-activated chloride channel family protein [Candidatus Azotimanducaceae bacterium]|jgi:Ca-activated chloride channel family protein